LLDTAATTTINTDPPQDCGDETFFSLAFALELT
jgi:hypothetical protein